MYHILPLYESSKFCSVSSSSLIVGEISIMLLCHHLIIVGHDVYCLFVFQRGLC